MFKSNCPICWEEIKEGEKVCKFKWCDKDHIVHNKCAHPKNKQLERIERMLKWLVIDSKLCDEEDWVMRHEKSEEYENVRKRLPDISDILKKKK